MSEKEFWRITPRKLFALLDSHRRANTPPEEGESQSKAEPITSLEELMALKNMC